MGFWCSKIRTRRKDHRCETCGQTVRAGEKSWDESGLYQGDFNSYRQCAACKDIVRYFFWRGSFDRLEGYQLNELAEYCRDEGLIWPPQWNYVAGATLEPTT
ncbi:hypothetical protein [Sphingomonas pituitosa]|uniref:hypothetical protein n=1 Tax=Sphingomonas pituitosa TaxID=99597 RepID=UPI00082BAEC8|nr:hypothetical protein [Sphingomonas pituitosa]